MHCEPATDFIYPTRALCR